MNIFEKGRARRGVLLSSYGSPIDAAIVPMLWALAALFIIYPIACIAARSVRGAAGGLTLAHFSRVFDRYLPALFNSVKVGLATAFLCTALSMSTALVVASSRGALRALLIALLLITIVSPPFVSSLAYIQLYGRRGWITYRLLGISWSPYNLIGVVLMQSITFVPIGALLLSNMISRIDPNTIRAARDLGAGPAAALRGVIIPQTSAGAIAVFLLNFVRSLADFGTPTIIGGRSATLASEIYLQLIGWSDIELTSAMNVLLLLPSLGAFFIYRRLMKKVPQGNGREARLDVRLSRCGVVGVGAIIGGAIFFAAMSLQYLCVFASGFIKSTRGGITFTLEHLAKLIAVDKSTMIRSVGYSLVVAAVGTIIAMLASYYIDRRKIRTGALLDCVVTLPYMIPGTCFGIGYLIAFGRSTPFKLTGTATIVIASMIFKQLPTTTRICSAMLTRIPTSLENAVRDLGGGRLAVLRDVILPLMRPASCFIYNFSAAMTTAGAVIFLIDPGKKVAVFKLFDAAYVGEYATASLIASWMILTVLAVEGIGRLILKKMGR